MSFLQAPRAPEPPRMPGGAGLTIPHPSIPHPFGAGFMHRDVGGSVDPTQSGIGGFTPSATTQSPLMQSMIQRYSSMPTEKLTELSAMMGASQQGQVIQRLLQQRRTMPLAPQQGQPQQQQTAAPAAAPAPQQQPAPAAALPPQAVQQRRGGATPRRADGGDMGISPSQGTPWWSRSQARGEDASSGGSTTGFLHGPTPGRADQVSTQSPAGSYVFPADVVAGLGEGNSLAGARTMQAILDSGPHGIPQQRGARGMGPPRDPAPYREAKGGNVPGEAAQTPVALSHGEFVATPHHAASWGGGDVKRGHRIFDRWVVAMRKAQIAKLKSLPGPVKS